MRKLPEPIRERIASEFRFAAETMALNADLPSKLYFFSVFYGELVRMLNQSWSPELALTQQVLKTTYESINGRINSPVPEQVKIPPEVPDALDNIARDIATLFEGKKVDDTRLFQILARAAVLAYAVTGNGFYLYLKGDIKIETGAPTALPPPAAQSPTGASSKASRRGKARP